LAYLSLARKLHSRKEKSIATIFSWLDYSRDDLAVTLKKRFALATVQYIEEAVEKITHCNAKGKQGKPMLLDEWHPFIAMW
jgi:hypothetical protein